MARSSASARYGLLVLRRRCTNRRWYMDVPGLGHELRDHMSGAHRMQCHIVSRAGFSVYHRKNNRNVPITTIVDGSGDLSYEWSLDMKNTLKDVYLSPSAVCSLASFLKNELGVKDHPFDIDDPDAINSTAEQRVLGKDVYDALQCFAV